MRATSAAMAAALAALALLAGPAAGGEGAPGAKPAPGRTSTSVRGGKPAAPVEISVTPAADRARLEIRFLAPGRGVEVRVTGTDGLAVTSPEVAVAGDFARGDVVRAEATFVAPPGQASLVVRVQGVFAGGRNARVATVTIGEPSAAQKAARPRVRAAPGAGEAVEELPAQVR